MHQRDNSLLHSVTFFKIFRYPQSVKQIKSIKKLKHIFLDCIDCQNVPSWLI